ncbi:MAG TPA: sulfatase [Rubrobacter sp.]|nr:sulfatase [Rubrobacter sp.]
MRRIVFLLTTLLTAMVLASAGILAAQTAPAEQPNILFVMTDDQPKDTLLAMPKVRERIVNQGLNLTNAYVSESLCCPSRATILTGQYPHNTQVMRNGPPKGGHETFVAQGLEDDNVGHWLREAGYTTGFVGKYMNGYDASYKPPGWSYWYAKADGNTPGERVNNNGPTKNLAGDGKTWTDRFTPKATGFLDRSTDAASDAPFALFFWPTQPHLEAGDYAERYADLYRNEPLNPKPSFDEADVSDKPQWIRELPRIGEAKTDQLRQWRRNQLRSLRQVDDAVGKVLDLLAKRGELENTYVVYTTDNGTGMGDHRWFNNHGMKQTPYEEAANVYLFVRGPDVPEGGLERKLALNNDFAPTFVDVADGRVPGTVDGRSLLPILRGDPATWRTAVMNERPINAGHGITPYHAIITERYTYAEYTNGDRELYDRKEDPYQLRSQHNNPETRALRDELSRKLADLKMCAVDAAKQCQTAENVP